MLTADADNADDTRARVDAEGPTSLTRRAQGVHYLVTSQRPFHRSKIAERAVALSLQPVKQ